MRVTVAGCGDAFGSGGRFNSCFLVESGQGHLALDFGASSMVALSKLGLDPGLLDAVVLSHLHGDHFGGLPFLLLHQQYEARRSRPLTIVGPLGTRARLDALMEAMFPHSSEIAFGFDLVIVDLPCGQDHALVGGLLRTFEVEHPSGAPATALRFESGGRILAYSGDTRWTEALLLAAAGADLFICECFSYSRPSKTHLDWPTVAANLPRFGASRVLLTHMNPDMLAHCSHIDLKNAQPATDGLVLAL